ncbi:hypothetical protein K458DRAFT_447535 [Lentithecium fluviatile CBS 122367]|uniref:Uncharacterized protein n=1 Tax=Lentithecium fluviatile CBS 122367 TaxID=1168545 RepID=A0A6G1IE78_9PLEO|nr:hypothetical protein K458DRAFT_447535 [Lentithecium fluviatile CBS 122367]
MALGHETLEAGWAATGLFPFSPERVLRDTPKPPAQAAVPRTIKDAHTLNKLSKQCLQRHVQKLANAARISFAKCALLQDQNQFLYKINNEAKEKASAGKAKRGGKRESLSLEVDATSSVAKRKAARMSELLEPAEAPVAPWRTLVARMY